MDRTEEPVLERGVGVVVGPVGGGLAAVGRACWSMRGGGWCEAVKGLSAPSSARVDEVLDRL